MRGRHCRLSVSTLLTALVAVTATAQTRIGVGIMPVQDASRAGYGEQMAPYLTRLLFERLEAVDIEPVYLNPGGGYTPLDRKVAVEHAASTAVDVVLFGTLQPAENPRSKRPTLVLALTAVNVKDARPHKEIVVTTKVRRTDLQRGFDRGRLVEQRIFVPYSGLWSWVAMQPSRKLAKQPLGKAAGRLADDAVVGVPTELRTVASSGTRPVRHASAAACDVEFRVWYTPQKAASKNYLLVVNDREESLAVVDGVARLRVSGPLVVAVSVKDPPWSMLVQPAYLANTWIDCARPSNAATLEIGANGQAMLIP